MRKKTNLLFTFKKRQTEQKWCPARMVSLQISLTKAEGVLRNLAEFTGKPLCQSLFFKGTPMQI